MPLFKKKQNSKKTEDKKEVEQNLSKQVSSSAESARADSNISHDRKIRAYQVVLSPHITEKATSLDKQNQYIFRVYFSANKTETKKAIEALYNVKVTKVRMIHVPPKRRRLGRQTGWRGGLKKGYKKAVVSLREGDKIEIIPGA